MKRRARARRRPPRRLDLTVSEIITAALGGALVLVAMIVLLALYL